MYKKQIGQYFTVSDKLQKFVFDKVKHKSSALLEPSFGAGHLLKKFKEYDNNYPMVGYELDTTIKPVIKFNENQTIIYGDFTAQTITTKFKTIVGNPPYVKQKTSNLYIKFIEQCYNYLDDASGELIFIVPSDFIKLTSASSIIDKMKETGSFTDFLFSHDEADVDVASASAHLADFNFDCCHRQTDHYNHRAAVAAAAAKDGAAAAKTAAAAAVAVAVAVPML
jgi:adenine-specific DNA-methyltransferase